MTVMDPGRWRQLQDLFAAAHARAPAERERLLREEASGDPALAEQVRALLAADGSGGVLDSLSPHIASVA